MGGNFSVLRRAKASHTKTAPDEPLVTPPQVPHPHSVAGTDDKMGATRRATVARASVRVQLNNAINRQDSIADSEEMHPSMLLKLAQTAEEELEQDFSDVCHRPLIALVAHDNMKPLMATFAQSYKDLLKDFRLTGTQTSQRMLKSVGLAFEDTTVPSGPLGGDAVIATMITRGEVQALFFFKDPLSAHPHLVDIDSLCRIADTYQIYVCTNYRTASGVLEFMHQQLHKRLGQSSFDPCSSIRIPAEMSDLGDTVQKKYLETRAKTIQLALDSSS